MTSHFKVYTENVFPLGTKVTLDKDIEGTIIECIHFIEIVE